MTGLKATASGPLALGEVLFPVAAAEGDGAQRDAVLLEAQREVAAGGADALGRLGQADVGGAQHGPLIAVAEGGQAFDLPHGLVRERGERRFGVDEQFGVRNLPAKSCCCGICAEIRAEGVDDCFVDREAGGRFVAAVTQ